MRVGAWLTDAGRCCFRVWAPSRKNVAVTITAPEQRRISLEAEDFGYWFAEVDKITPGTRYLIRLDDELERPDPASRYQSDGVHQSSEIVTFGEFSWHDQQWTGIPLSEMIMYELHVGAFTPEGTFRAIIPRLQQLKDLGVNAIELMPVAQFPGERNWGYDGVFPWAVHNSYGGPWGLMELVDAAHAAGLAVIMDVVYNHLGPEGNYLHDFGPYFTTKYRTPWGEAVNFDGPHSNAVRNYFIENALAWLRDYHIDALRLDAIHGIFDMSAKPFLQELNDRVTEYAAEIGKPYPVIAESDLNDSRVIRPPAQGGYGLPAQWSDDLHHALHTLLTGEQGGYYADFGEPRHLAKAIRNGYIYNGNYSRFRRRNHGNSPAGCDADQFVVASQNHDQVGNRLAGDRLTTLVSFEALKLAAGVVLLGPNIPLLWMGEEYAEPAPFQYFVSHGDPDLVEAVRRGRQEEFAAFGWQETPPDPQSPETFERSKLDWSLRDQGHHRVMLQFYRRLIELRRSVPTLATLTTDGLEIVADDEQRVIFCRRQRGNSIALYVMNFNDHPVRCVVQLAAENLRKVLDSADQTWQGPGGTLTTTMKSGRKVECQPWNIALYVKEKDA